MGDVKLFRLTKGVAVEVTGSRSDLEKSLQTLIENNLESLLGIRFLATEYATGKTHAGRIDSLGIDENDCPVIIEYKRSVAENVINQGLFYLDWLMDHRAEFKLLVMEKLGGPAAEEIDWSAPRLICIASDFTKYDAHAVQQMKRNIELIRYRRFGADLLLLELANAVAAAEGTTKSAKPAPAKGTGAKANAWTGDKPFANSLADAAPGLVELVESLDSYIKSMGDDVQRKDLKLYRAYKRLRNFASVVLKKKQALLYLHLDPKSIKALPPNARNVRGVGHWGTGDLELLLSTLADVDEAKPFILGAYQGRA